MSHYLTTVRKNETPQNEALEGQVANNAGGFAFPVNHWTRLERFLIMGSEGGTYYVGQNKLTRENMKSVEVCLKEDGIRLVNTVVDVSTNGRAPKNDVALFVHAFASVEGDAATRRLAHETLHKVARIGTHLFQWMNFRKHFGGFGTGAKKAVTSWYNDKDADALGYQLSKYKQRDGWTHLDVLRLAHVKPKDEAHDALLGYAKAKAKGEKINSTKFNALPEQVRFIESLAARKPTPDVLDLVTKLRVPREALPTEWLQKGEVWEALLPNMPITATIRNLGNMSKAGILTPMSANEKLVVARITNEEILKKGRVHPIAVLAALKTYEQGHGLKGSGTWDVNHNIVDALDEGFYTSFKAIEPTGKRHVLGIDVSGSMGWSFILNRLIDCGTAAAVMALATAKSEDQFAIMGFASQFRDLGISPRMRLDDVLRKMSGQVFGSTDCSLPMVWALQNKVESDVFVVYTDSETYAGRSHPVQALQKYRDKMGIPAKLVVVAFASNHVSIADPNDAGMLDVAGFDTNTPSVIADFIRG